jgi:3-oxoacyl-[acyl-carrier-protein] synthase-3
LNDKILVVAAEIYSRILNPKDFSTYPYFGDGAGAVLLTRSTEVEGPQIMATVLGSDGAGADLIQVPAGGSMLPFGEGVNPLLRYFTMNGRAVFEFAARKGAEVIQQTLQAAKIDKERISHVVVHQANINIVNRIADNSGIPRSKFFVNLDQFGNTAAASVLIALDGLLAKGETRAGSLVLIVAFGGGLSWGCSLVRL